MTTSEIINQLFEEARQRNILEYIFTLLRTNAIESYDKDELLVIKDDLSSSKLTKDQVLNFQAIWHVIGNLKLVNQGQSYKPYLLFSSKNFVQTILPLTSGKLKHFLEENILKDDENSEWLSLIKAFLDKYYFELASFKESPNFYKLPRFEILETLVDTIVGLYGFKIYFSNGSNAEFTRDEKGTSGINLMLDDTGVGFQVGFIDKMIDEWRIGDKRLCEFGLRGKYNKTGEWKPIVYPGDFGKLEKEALALSKDERVQGVVFYMLCTGYRVIEFVAKMSINLPEKHTVLPGKVHLENLTITDTSEPQFLNGYIYDGWLELEDFSDEAIKDGIGAIQRAMQGLAFAFDNEVRWNLKYTIASHRPGVGAPQTNDVRFLNRIIKETQKTKDPVIDTAVSWYQLGILTQNPLNALLCFHIAIEGLAMKLANGELEASETYGFKPESKESKNKRLTDCFKEYYDKYFTADIKKMIEGVYFEGIGSIKFHLKRALEGVFGDKSSVIDEYFKGKDSIWRIRGELAHGEYSDWHDEKYMMAWRKLAPLQDISKSFLTRVILKVPSGKRSPGWTREHTFALGMDDPRSTLAVSRIDVLPRQDWSIRPEWID